MVRSRVRSWQRFHRRMEKVATGVNAGASSHQNQTLTVAMGEAKGKMDDMQQQMAQLQKEVSSLQKSLEEKSDKKSKKGKNKDKSDKAVAKEPRMAVLEVIMVGNESSGSLSRGINLLEGLSLQAEGTLINTEYENVVDKGSVTTDSATHTTGLSLSVPQVEYTLNIVNEADSSSKILARPSVIAVEGETSEFFLGANIIFMTGGDYDSVIEKDVGLKIKATPEFLSDDTAKIQIETEFSSLGSGIPVGDLIGIDTEMANGKVSSVMRFGETLAVSTGFTLQEKSDMSGIPVLNRVPLVDNFTSQRKTSVYKDSLLILVSLRPPRSYADKNRVSKKWSIFGDELERKLHLSMLGYTSNDIDAQRHAKLNTMADYGALGIAHPDDVMPYDPVLFMADEDDTVKQRRGDFIKALVDL